MPWTAGSIEWDVVSSTTFIIEAYEIIHASNYFLASQWPTSNTECLLIVCSSFVLLTVVNA